MITTTLNRIRAHKPCGDGWGKLLTGLGKTKADDEPLPFTKIVEINGLYDALWCCQAEPQYTKEWRLFAVWCARRVQHLMKDQRSIDAIDVAERYANGEATEEELTAAKSAAIEAALGVAMEKVAWKAAHAARAARATTYQPAYFAAREGADFAAMDAADFAEHEAQQAEFLRLVTETEARVV